jgi:hypothetical protein
MKRTYTIIIEAKKGHQPSQDEIFQALNKLISNRVLEFPIAKSGTHVTLIPNNQKRS